MAYMIQKALPNISPNSYHVLPPILYRYRGGIRGHIKQVVQDLLKQYLRVENQFQSASYDKCVAQIRDANPNSMADVTADIFSNSQVKHKNVLVIELIVSFMALGFII